MLYRDGCTSGGLTLHRIGEVRNTYEAALIMMITALGVP